MFNGQRGHHDLVSHTEEYFRLLRENIKEEEELREKLKEHPDLLQILEKINDSFIEMCCECEDIFYREGFKFGVLMGIEIAGDSGE